MNHCEFFYEEKQLSLLRIDNYVAGVKNVPVWQLRVKGNLLVFLFHVRYAGSNFFILKIE